MKFLNITATAVLLTAVFSACEPELESEGIAEGVIRYPSIILNEGPSQALVAGEDAYEELGAVALLGADDISSQLVIEGEEDVDASTPGVYPVNYSVTITNELNEPMTVTQTRYVLVTSEDISDVDLSGDYVGSGFSSSPLTMSVTKLGNGWYRIPDVLSSANGIAATFAHLGGNVIIIPNQSSGFGDVNTTTGGANATLTEDGFRWTVYIDCCGLFGPVNFVRQ
jgi:hypothetical protein